MDITSKFSLYDVLAMIIPGGIIMASIAMFHNISYYKETIELCCGYSIEVNKDLTMIEGFFLLTFAYLIGLINNWINNGIFRFFRNDQISIHNELRKVIKDNGNIHLHKYVGSKYDNDKTPIYCLLFILIRTLKNIFKALCICRICSRNSNPKDYYKAYYCLSKANLLGSVPLIESQVALLRNSLLPLILLTISLAISNDNSMEYLWWVTGAITILSFIVMVQRQNKVYSLIWESANYYDL
ncbi:MAG: hypothetical protein K2L11_10270 [Muribaculaceae bacterium]|nr:hypothetical protein [Muribaculaceae bacterium]